MLCVLVCVCSCLHMDKRQTNSISGEGRERERDCRKGRTPSVATNEENRGESNRKRAININPEEEEAIKSKRGNFKKPSFNLSPVSLSLYPSFLPFAMVTIQAFWQAWQTWQWLMLPACLAAWLPRRWWSDPPCCYSPHTRSQSRASSEEPLSLSKRALFSTSAGRFGGPFFTVR